MTLEATPDSIWTVVANIVAIRPFGPGGKELKRGTKHFRPGCKVYIVDWYAGMCEKIVVIGKPRQSRRFIKIVIPVTWVENLRVKVCYQPQVIEKIKEHYPGNQLEQLNLTFAQTMYKVIPLWQKEMGKEQSPSEIDFPPKTNYTQRSNFLNKL